MAACAVALVMVGTPFFGFACLGLVVVVARLAVDDLIAAEPAFVLVVGRVWLQAVRHFRFLFCSSFSRVFRVRFGRRGRVRWPLVLL